MDKKNSEEENAKLLKNLANSSGESLDGLQEEDEEKEKDPSDDSSNDVTKNDVRSSDISCTLCNNTESEAKKFFKRNATSKECVCDVCALLMFKILISSKLNENGEYVEGEGSSEDIFKNLHNFVPSEIKKKLDEHIIGQGHAKRLMAVAVYNHKKRLEYNRSANKSVEISKSNILMIGPTGSGKTLLADTIAKILNIPFVSADVTSLTEAGYVGEDVESIIQKLYWASGSDVTRTQVGIVCLDEIDKIAKKTDQFFNAKDVSGEGVQQGLLKIIEGSVVYVAPQNTKRNAQSETIPIDTQEILFICCGAFSGLDKIIAERLTKTKMGFGAQIEPKKNDKQNLFRKVEVDDLIRYGLIPEFVSRLHIICVLDELDESLLVRILTEPKNSIVKQYETLLSLDKVELKFTAEALTMIAKLARKRKNGARALRSIMESFLYDEMYSIPDQKHEDGMVLEINAEFIKKKLQQSSEGPFDISNMSASNVNSSQITDHQ